MAESRTVRLARIQSGQVVPLCHDCHLLEACVFILFYYVMTCRRPWTGLFSKLLSISKHLPVAITFKREFDGDNIPGDQVFLQNSTEVLFPCPEFHYRKLEFSFFCSEAGENSLPHLSSFLLLIVSGMCADCLLCKLGSFFCLRRRSFCLVFEYVFIPALLVYTCHLYLYMTVFTFSPSPWPSHPRFLCSKPLVHLVWAHFLFVAQSRAHWGPTPVVVGGFRHRTKMRL